MTPHEYDQRWNRACAILDQEAGAEHDAGGATLSARALRCAIALIKEFEVKRLLELGSGSSTAGFASLCQTLDCSLDSVEHDERYLERTHALLRDTCRLRAHSSCSDPRHPRRGLRWVSVTTCVMRWRMAPSTSRLLMVLRR